MNYHLFMAIDYKNKKILVVEDQAFMRLSLVKQLVEIGFQEMNIVACENGKTAYDILKSEIDEFDIILSDWKMPRMNGLDLLRSVRTTSAYFRHVPFILTTTVSEKEKVVEALNYNVSAYLLKPIQVQKLKESLKRIFTEGDE
jgi:two-component system chemotaxis response regulator CheY